MDQYLILVKHSLPEIEQNRPARAWHLSDEGRRRAERLANRLLAYRPQVLISSVEPKARETSEILGRALQLDVHVSVGLHEHDRSGTPYLSKDSFEQSVRAFFSEPAELVFGRETANEAYVRFSNAVGSIRDAHADQSIAIVSHGTVISLFVSHLTGISDYGLWNQLGLPSFVALDMKSNAIVVNENIP